MRRSDWGRSTSSSPSSQRTSKATNDTGVSASRRAVGWRTCIRRCRRWKLVWPFSLNVTTSPSSTAECGARASARPASSGIGGGDLAAPPVRQDDAGRARRSPITRWPSSLGSNRKPSGFGGMPLPPASMGRSSGGAGATPVDGVGSPSPARSARHSPAVHVPSFRPSTVTGRRRIGSARHYAPHRDEDHRTTFRHAPRSSPGPGGRRRPRRRCVVVQVGPAPARAAPDDAGRPVALVLVRDLTWSTAPSSLDGFAKANLSMRTAQAEVGRGRHLPHPRQGRPVEPGWGARPGVGRVEPTPGRRPPPGRLGGAARTTTAGLHYGGGLGSVGEALRDGGRRWALVERRQRRRRPPRRRPTGSCPGPIPGTADGVRSAVRAEPDAVVVAVPGPRPGRRSSRSSTATCTLVVSASTPDENRHLGVLAASPPCGLGTAGLASPSTHHDHLATLPDVSRTFLDLVGIARPAVGRRRRSTPADRRSTGRSPRRPGPTHVDGRPVAHRLRVAVRRAPRPRRRGRRPLAPVPDGGGAAPCWPSPRPASS